MNGMNESRPGLSAFGLKTIALILMTIDHIGYFIPGAPFSLRMIGRLSAPVFFFVAANSLLHTSNRAAYILRLYIASATMEVIKMAVFFFDADSRFIVTNNIFTTLFFSVFLAHCVSTSTRYFIEKDLRKAFAAAAAALVPVIWTLAAKPRYDLAGWSLKSILPTLTGAEGGVLWIIMGVGFCLFAGNKKALIAFYGAFCLFLFLQTVRFSGPAALFTRDIQWMMVFAAPLFLLYNGQKGPGFKWLFYAYYPLHIWVLYFTGRALVR